MTVAGIYGPKTQNGMVFRMVTKFVLSAVTFGVLNTVALGLAHGQGAPITYGEASRTPSSPPASRADALLAKTGDVRTDKIIFRYPGSTGPQPVAPATTMPSYATVPQVSQQMAALPQSDLYQTPTSSAASRPVQSESFDFNGSGIRVTSLSPTPSAPVAPVPDMTPLRISKVTATEGAALGEQRGLVGMYPGGFDGKPTANGEVFDPAALTGAHPTLPLPSLVQLQNERTGQEIVVRVNDRGPFMADRLMDVSPGAARALSITEAAPATLKVRYLGPAPVQMKKAPEVQQVALRAEPETLYTPAQPRISAAPTPRNTYGSASSAPAAQATLFVQAGSFVDIGNAQGLTERLGRNLPVKIESARVNGGDYFRVMVGPFSSRSEADRVRDQLERDGTASGYIVKR